MQLAEQNSISSVIGAMPKVRSFSRVGRAEGKPANSGPLTALALILDGFSVET